MSILTAHQPDHGPHVLLLDALHFDEMNHGDMKHIVVALLQMFGTKHQDKLTTHYVYERQGRTLAPTTSPLLWRIDLVKRQSYLFTDQSQMKHIASIKISDDW